MPKSTEARNQGTKWQESCEPEIQGVRKPIGEIQRQWTASMPVSQWETSEEPVKSQWNVSSERIGETFSYYEDMFLEKYQRKLVKKFREFGHIWAEILSINSKDMVRKRF